MEVKRGEVWFVSFGHEPKGAEPAFDRPAVVVQDDLLNDSSLWTIMVAPFTSNLEWSQVMGNVLIKSSVIEWDSVALVCQVVALDRSQFGRKLGTLTRKQMHAVDRGLALALGLSATVGSV